MKCNLLENELEKTYLDKKMSLSQQKVEFEKEITEITQKFTKILRESENKHFEITKDLQ